MTRTLRSLATAAIATLAVLTVGTTPAAADDDPVYLTFGFYDFFEASAVGPCPEMAYLRLDGDIAAADEQVAMNCNITLDLAGYDFSLLSIALTAGAEFIVEDSSLDADGTLTVDASAVAGAAAIRTADAAFTLTGGNVIARGGSHGAGVGGETGNPAGGSITVHGGSLVAAGGEEAAGIGSADGGSGLTQVLLDGGDIEATGGLGGAGVGSGFGGPAADVTIDGATVTAHAGSFAAGIGGGAASPAGTITILSGVVDAHGNGGAGIGGGKGDQFLTPVTGDIVIAGGMITANADGPGAGIGGGGGYTTGGGTVDSVTIHGGTISAIGSSGIGPGVDISPTFGALFPIVIEGATIDVTGGLRGTTSVITGATVTGSGGLHSSANEITNSDVTLSDGVHGTTTLVDSTLDATTAGTSVAGGVTVTQSTLVAVSTSVGVGIDGPLHLVSGDVTAAGNGNGNGIQGAVTVEAGTLTVTSTGDGNGIDGGTTITGGAVDIEAGSAGIQGDLSITDATLTVVGGFRAAGIGGDGAFTGGSSSGSTVDIGVGAVVTAQGQHSAIGAGASGTSFGTLTVAGLLRLPTGSLVVLDTALGAEVTVLGTGRIEGTEADPTMGATISGDGSIDNHGSIRLATANIGVEVDDHNYLVTFDAQEGAPTPDPVRVFAPTFDDGARVVPDLPTRFARVGTAWNLAADGSGAVFDGSTVIDADTTAFATWDDIVTVSPTTWAELEAALDGCSGVVVVQLGADIPADSSASVADRLAVDCETHLDVNGHRLAIDGVDVAPGVDLTLHDGLGGGEIDLAAAAGADPALRATDATVTIRDVVLEATGGALAAGIGGGSGQNGGDVVLGDGADVTARGGSTAIGAGAGGTAFGSLEVGGVLRVPSTAVHVLDGTGTEITVTSDGSIVGTPGDPTAGGELTGNGQLQNDGVITLATALVTAGSVEVLGNNYLVTFDPAYAGGTFDDIRVFAPTFAAGARDLPALPEFYGHAATAWQLSGSDFGAGSTLTADSTLVAHWAGLLVVDDVTDDVVVDDALDGCTGLVVVVLGGDVPADTSTTSSIRPDLGCDAVIELAGHRLGLTTIRVNSGHTLTVADSGGGGELVADASSHDFNDGLTITGATLNVLGGTVTAISGLQGVGVGNGHGNGGDIDIAAGAELVAIGSHSALGAGVARDVFGTVSVAGTLRLPSGPVSLPPGTGAVITVEPGGRIVGSSADEAQGAFLFGDGEIVNHGTVTLAASLVGIEVTDHNYLVAFDAQGGTPASTQVRVFATSFDAGRRVIPATPTRPGFSFDGWTIDAAGAGATFTTATAVTGDTTVYAQWTADAAPTPTPTPTPTSPPAPPGTGSGSGSSPSDQDSGEGDSPAPDPTATPTATPSPSEESAPADPPAGAGEPSGSGSGWDAWWIPIGFGVLLLVVVAGVVIFVRRG